MKNIEIAKNILQIRLGQMIINESLKRGEFKIPIHLALGHEAIAVAVDSVMENCDQLVLNHRNIHYNLARTKLLKPELDEYLLKKEGLAGGQLGSMNLANEEKNIIYTSSILGNNLGVAAGLALAKKVNGSGGVVFMVTGDGAMEEGIFYECLEFMKSNALPSLVIIENNKWSLATEIKERRCDISIQKIGEAMDIGYEKLEGNDIYEYINKLITIRKFTISNKTPFLIEVELTTMGGWYLKTIEHPTGRFINYHAGSAPEINLARGSLIENSARDPVFVLQKYFSRDLLEKMEQEVLYNLRKEINEIC